MRLFLHILSGIILLLATLSVLIIWKLGSLKRHVLIKCLTFQFPFSYHVIFLSNLKPAIAPNKTKAILINRNFVSDSLLFVSKIGKSKGKAIISLMEYEIAFQQAGSGWTIFKKALFYQRLFCAKFSASHFRRVFLDIVLFHKRN